MVNLQIDMSQGFAQVFATWKTFFVSIINFMDNIIIIGGVSLLDFNIAVLIFGLLFTSLFSVVRNGVTNSMKSVKNSKKQKEE